MSRRARRRLGSALATINISTASNEVTRSVRQDNLQKHPGHFLVTGVLVSTACLLAPMLLSVPSALIKHPRLVVRLASRLPPGAWRILELVPPTVTLFEPKLIRLMRCFFRTV